MKTSHISYLNRIFKNNQEYRDVVIEVSRIVKKMLRSGKIDFIVGRGNSGALICGPVSFHSGVPMVIVRKPGEQTHSYIKCEGLPIDDYKEYKYVIIDDLIDSGNTVYQTMSTIEMNYAYQCPLSKAKCIGTVLYNQYDDNTGTITTHFAPISGDFMKEKMSDYDLTSLV